jgi:cyclohexanecarboxylate-CoA ligase
MNDIGERIRRVHHSHHERYEDKIPVWKEKNYWTNKTFPQRAKETVQEYPQKRAVGPDESATLKEIYNDAKGIAAELQSLGIEKGDVISFSLPNWVVTNKIYLAITLVGAIANPIVPIYRHREFEYILQDSEASCLIIPDTYREFNYPDMIDDLRSDLPTLDDVVVVGEAPEWAINFKTFDFSKDGFDEPELFADDPHLLLYTSGTTADPKGVLHTHNTLGADEVLAIERMEITPDVKPFLPSPVTHITGVFNALELPFVVGMSFVLMDQWDPEEAVEMIENEQCTRTGGATPFIEGLLDAAPEKWDCPLELITTGGAYVSPGLIRKTRETFDCRVSRAYGSTEYPGMTKTPLDAPAERGAKTDGKLQQGVVIKIVDIESRKPLPDGQEGEILVYGPNLMLGYNKEELNQDAFDGKWYKTGDVGYLDGRYITITGRTKDIIIRGGENIPVKDVEDKLYEHPAIENVAIVAMPDPDMQEKGCAYIKTVEGEDITFDEMVDYLEEQRIAKQKYPERLEVVDEFPRTASGKIQKNVLREEIANKLGMDPVRR